MRTDHWPSGVQRYHYVDKMLKLLNNVSNSFQNHRPHGADTLHCQWNSGRQKSLFSSKFTAWPLQNLTWGDLHVWGLGWWWMGILLHPASSSSPPSTLYLGSLLHTSGQCPIDMLPPRTILQADSKTPPPFCQHLGFTAKNEKPNPY